MKRIVLISIFVSLTLASCVQHMEEVETAMISGAWAKVDENNMVSIFLTFDRGYLYEYKSGGEYYFHNNIVWGAPFSSVMNGNRYKYTLTDGVLHYHNYYEDVYTDVIREGDAIIFDGNKYLMLNDIRQSQYSRIILSESNKTDLDYRGEYIEWDYEIENPVQGYELQVLEAPEWCGGIEGVAVSDDKISFHADSTILRTEGKFKFSYRTAQDVEIKVKQVAPVQIFLEQTSLNFDHRGGFSGIRYTILNATDLIKPSVTTDVKWIRVYDFDEDDFMFVVDENSKSDDRTGKITLTYGNVSASCIVYQEGSIWADWI